MVDRNATIGLLVVAATVCATVAVTPQTRALAITRVNVVDVADGRIVPNTTVTISGALIAGVAHDGAPRQTRGWWTVSGTCTRTWRRLERRGSSSMWRTA